MSIKLFGFVPRSVPFTRIYTRAYLPHRSKVTLIQSDFANQAKVKRPLPIVLVQSSQDQDKSWPLRWQEKLAGLGYRSSYIHLDKTDATSSRLDIWYKDLVQAMQEHSYFPPLLIGHGEDAWKTCQKYVCNKPVSGLVLLHQDQATDPLPPLPSFEFEPHFPLCVLAPMGKVPPFLQDEQVDHVETSPRDSNDSLLQHTLKWMDDANM